MGSIRRMIEIDSKFLKSEKGSTLVLIALLMPILMGFCALVIDIGTLYFTKAKLQKTADAAALAAVQDLKTTNDPVATAINYARQNGMKATVNKIKESGDTVTVNTPYLDSSTGNYDSTKIEVICTRNERPIFAGVLNPTLKSTGTDVSARAVATKKAIPGGISGLRPWAITNKCKEFGADGTWTGNWLDYTFTYGQEFQLKAGGGDGTNGYYGRVSFGTQEGDLEDH